ncbi:MAG: carbohydrate ABC transporter permease [Chitinispirillaceae bacterium]
MKMIDKHTGKYDRREVGTALIFVAPVLAVTVAFILFPILGTCFNSLFRDVAYLPKKFIGFENYSQLFSSAGFWRATGFTLLFTIAAVILEVTAGLLFALLLNETFRARGILRAVILIPWAIPTVIAGRTWQLMYQYSYGVVNFVITQLGISGNVNWLGSAGSAFWAIVIADVWKTTPFVVIILLAGLQAIPRDIYLQAKVDGASMLRRFVKITLPLLSPVIIVALIFRTIDSLRIFDLVYVLTGGGPGGKTQTLSYLGFRYFNNDQFGLGSAVSVIMFTISFIVTLVYIHSGKFHKSMGK